MRFKFASKEEMIDTCQGLAYSLPYMGESNIDLLVKSDYYADDFDKEKC